MNLRTLLSFVSTRCLPALLLPAVLLAAGSAHAALEISNGFLSAKKITTVGHDFSFNQSGTVVLGGVVRATSVQMTCSVDTIAKTLHCDGALTLQATSAPIRMDFDSATGRAEWSISSSASAALSTVHEEWGHEIPPDMLGDPPPWEHINFFDGLQWRKWWYTTTWAQTYESITGLQYGDIYTW
jgi:hypothetical protein